MDDDETNLHLSQIETRWTLVFQAHRDQAEASHEAQEVLTRRYGRAVHRYLLRITRDPEAAADLAQDFALRMVRGDFRRADPSRGRFRDFIKTSIQHLVIDHHRRRRTQPQSMPASGVEIATEGAEPSDLDEKFLACWREELMNHAWDGLREHQERTGRPLFLVLRYRADHPEMRSHEMAERLSPLLPQPVNASWVRQTLLRARKRYVRPPG